MENQKPDQKQSLKGCGILILLVGIISLLMYFGGCFERSPESKEQSDKIAAYSFAEKFVSQQLKSPSTAEFPGVLEFIDHVVRVEGNQFKIESYVDAQNGFGAMIRNRFQVVLTLSEDGESATLDRIDIY